MKILANKRFWTLLFYAWIITVYILTSKAGQPDSAFENESLIRLDYIKHFLAYFFIPVLYYMASGAFLEKIFKDKYYLILLGILFSILTEIQQYWIVGRVFNYWDLTLNLIGFLLGLSVGKYITGFLKRITVS